MSDFYPKSAKKLLPSQGLPYLANMLKEDYIMRIIRQASMMMGKLMQLNYVEEEQAALELINEAYDTALTIDAEALASMSNAQFTDWLNNADLHPTQLKLLAELLQAKGEIVDNHGAYVQSNAYFQRAIWTLERLNDVEQVFSMDRQATIRHLQTRLDQEANHQRD